MNEELAGHAPGYDPKVGGGGEKGLKKKCSDYVGVSLNGGTPRTSILIGFSVINHPFWGTPIFGNTHIEKGCCEMLMDSSQNHEIVDYSQRRL